MFGDRFGLWGRNWAEGYAPKENVTDYTFPTSDPILVSQYVGQYPNNTPSRSTVITHPSGERFWTTYKDTYITYLTPGRHYSVDEHQPSITGFSTTTDIAPFCWGSGQATTLTNTWTNAKGLEQTKTYIAVIDTFERDKNK